MLNTGSEYVKAVKKTALIGFPITAGHLSHVLMGFFDTIQVGGLGPDYIAASGVATAVYWLFTLIGTGILFVVAPMIAEAFGEKKPAKAVSIFKDSIALAGVISFITTIFFFLLIKKFEWFGQPKHINILAIKYLWIVNFSTPALIFFTAGRQMLEGLGKTTPVMIINFSGLVCNVALNDILIYGKDGLPAMGIQGAATATCITRHLQLIAIFFVLYRISFVKRYFKVSLSYNEASIHYYASILRLGAASSVQVFSEAASFSVAHIMSGWIGATELAAHQIAINLASVTFMFINGISNAGAVVTGYALGEKNINKIVAAGIAALSWCMIFELCFFTVFLLFPDKLAGIYTSDKQVGQLAARLIFFAALFQLSDGLQNIAIGLLRGLQDVRFSAIISFISYWLIMIPLCYWFAFIQGMEIEGIWLGFVIGLLAVAVLLTARYVFLLKRLRFD